MGQKILTNWRVITATLFSAVLVFSAYVLARGIEFPATAEASDQSELLQAIAARDSDSDGLTDWEEVLYGTDAHKSDSRNLGTTDGDAVAKGLIVPRAVADVPVATSTAVVNPINYAAEGLTPPTEGTVTDAFAKNFFGLYVSAKQANGGIDLTPEQTDALVEQSMTQFIQNFTPTADFKKISDLQLTRTDPGALRTFAIAAEAVITKYKNAEATKSDLEYFQDLIMGEDATAGEHLVSLSKSYRNSAVALAQIPVPSELAPSYLVIINVIMRMSEIDADLSRVNTDSIAAMLALNQYSSTDLLVQQAFTELARVYASEGVVLASGTPGAAFVNVMSDVEALVQASQNNP
jgi:hypothetical protein